MMSHSSEVAWRSRSRAWREPCQRRRLGKALALAWCVCALSAPVSGAEPGVQPRFKAFLVSEAQAGADRLHQLKREGYTAAVLALSDANAGRDLEAAARLQGLGFTLYYWIEIGRCPALADAHPEWMASLQGHPEWRRFFRKLPAAGEGEVVKNYPWVPVLYAESSAAHRERVKMLLAGKPAPRGIFLNDLQGAPSACGCGHHLCRWTSDYGPIKTATRLPNDAAARFVAAVKALAPGAEVVPVWTSECEAHDKEELCAGVGCYEGTCWKEFAAQLAPVAKECDRVAALLPYKAFQRDLPRYGPTAGWVLHAVRSFAETPQKVRLLPPERLLAVLQGWDTTAEEIQAQAARSLEAGTSGCIVSFMPIEQGWEPRLRRVEPRASGR